MAANNKTTNLIIPPVAPPIAPNRPGSRLNTMFPQTVFPGGKFFASPTFPHMSPVSSVQQIKAHNATTPTSRTPFMPSGQKSFTPTAMLPTGTTNYSTPNISKVSQWGQMGSSPSSFVRASQGLTAPTSYGTYGAGRPFSGGESASGGASYAKAMVRSWTPRAAWAQNNLN